MKPKSLTPKPTDVLLSALLWTAKAMAGAILGVLLVGVMFAVGGAAVWMVLHVLLHLF